MKLAGPGGGVGKEEGRTAGQGEVSCGLGFPTGDHGGCPLSRGRRGELWPGGERRKRAGGRVKGGVADRWGLIQFSSREIDVKP